MTSAKNGPSLIEVDAAVRTVLADLLAPARIPARARGGDVYAGRLLSMRHAETLPRGLTELRIAPGTVVTPLARETLKRLGIGLRFVAKAEVDRAAGVGEWGFAIERGSGVVEAFRRSLLDLEAEWHDLGVSADEAARWVAAQGNRGALVLTDEGALAVYRACQVEGVRAAAVEEINALAKAVRSLGVNLLVVEPAGKSIAVLRQVANAFRRSGGPVAPEGLGELRGVRAS